MAPDQPYESGCFSGSAVPIDGHHALIYTSHLDQDLSDGGHTTIEQQSLAIGDGTDYQKDCSNPVLCTAQLPEGACGADFRDPKVWCENGLYRMIVASRRQDGFGQCLLYESPDLRTWHYVTDVAHSTGALGRMWECPDYFPLDGRQVLLINAQEMPADGRGFHGKNGTAVMVGSADSRTDTFSCDTALPIDYGWDFYAPQTMLTEDGRRVMIAWLQSWDNNVTPADQDWAGMMTFPRELSIRDGMLYQLPVRELQRFHTHHTHISDVATEKERVLVRGRQLDLEIRTDEAAPVFCLDVAAGDSCRTRILVNGPDRLLTVDRSAAGMPEDRFPVQHIPLSMITGSFSLRVLLDRWSLELFINDGRQAVSVLLYTPQDQNEVRISAPSPLSYHFDCHEIIL